VSALPLLVDRDEAARALRCRPEVLDRLVAAGTLRPVFLDPADDQPKFDPEALVDLVERAGRLQDADVLARRAAALDEHRHGALAARQATALENYRAAASSPIAGAADKAGDQRGHLGVEDERLRRSSARARAAALILRLDPILETIPALQEAIRADRDQLLPAGTALGAIQDDVVDVVLDSIDALAGILRNRWPAALRLAQSEAALADSG
jgi:hypothetical protein